MTKNIEERIDFLTKINVGEMEKNFVLDMIDNKNLTKFKNYNYMQQKNEVSYILVAAYSFYVAQKTNGERNQILHNIVITGQSCGKMVLVKTISELLGMELNIPKDFLRTSERWLMCFDFIRNTITLLDENCSYQSKYWYVKYCLHLGKCPKVNLEYENTFMNYLQIINGLTDEERTVFDLLYKKIVKSINNKKISPEKIFSKFYTSIRLVSSGLMNVYKVSEEILKLVSANPIK